MHSNLVELLNSVIEESIYFGFINSGIIPLVSWSTSSYSISENINVLELPGKMLFPSLSTGSFPIVDLNKESS